MLKRFIKKNNNNNKKIKKLHVFFVDITKAYDRVPRVRLLEILKRLGCVRIMVKAVMAMFTCTKNVLKSAVIGSAISDRPGAPTSCLLFALYIDHRVKMHKGGILVDDFSGSLHSVAEWIRWRAWGRTYVNAGVRTPPVLL